MLYGVTISAKSEILELIVEKGSIAIDGISLTVAKLQTKIFPFLIPHTSEVTILLSKRVGEVVNLENDVIGKYVKKLMGKSEKKGITLEFLAENGF